VSSTHIQSLNKNKTRNTVTNRPTCAFEKCPFMFNICYSNVLKRWFIPCEGTGNWNHVGHIQLSQDGVRMSTKNLNPTLLDQVFTQLQLDINVSAIGALLNEESGFSLSAQQISSLRNNNVINSSSSGQDRTSPAERLMAYLNDSEDIRFVALTAKKEREKLVTVWISKKDRLSIQECSQNSKFFSDDDGDNTTKFAKRVIDALSLKEEETLLLGVAWVTDEGSRYFDLYPEVMGFDVTFGTNKEKRPMARGTIKNNRNKNIPFFNALLPSCASWVFNWIFHSAMPMLLKKESLNKLHLILVDDDEQCNRQIDSARESKILEKAHYRLCKWHKVRTSENAEFLNLKFGIPNFRVLDSEVRSLTFRSSEI
jgi:MULE transposase domain